jgi:hypothetical protein
MSANTAERTEAYLTNTSNALSSSSNNSSSSSVSTVGLCSRLRITKLTGLLLCAQAQQDLMISQPGVAVGASKKKKKNSDKVKHNNKGKKYNTGAKELPQFEYIEDNAARTAAYTSIKVRSC